MAGLVSPTGNTIIVNENTRSYMLGNPVLYSEPPLQANTTLKQVTGHVRDVNGAAIQGATVDMFRQRDNMPIGRTTTDVAGAYIFRRRSDDLEQYYTVAYSIAGGNVQVHGVSDRGLVPA